MSKTIEGTGKCIKCGQEIPCLYEHNKDEPGSPDGGSNMIIHSGFGSEHDLMEFLAVICDPCLRNSQHDGSVNSCRGYECAWGGLGPEEWKPISAHFDHLKVLWHQREGTEVGREINRKILANRGYKLWEAPEK